MIVVLLFWRTHACSMLSCRLKGVVHTGLVRFESTFSNSSLRAHTFLSTGQMASWVATQVIWRDTYTRVPWWQWWHASVAFRSFRFISWQRWSGDLWSLGAAHLHNSACTTISYTVFVSYEGSTSSNLVAFRNAAALAWSLLHTMAIFYAGPMKSWQPFDCNLVCWL